MTEDELMHALIDAAMAYGGPVGGLTALAAMVVDGDAILAQHITAHLAEIVAQRADHPAPAA